MHGFAAGEEALPRFTLGRVFTEWELVSWATLAILLTAGLYAWGVVRMHRRGDHWPVGRTLSFGTAMALAALATVSGLGVYDDTLLSVHMMQHMVLVGCLFFWPLVGIDPVPGRSSYPARMLLVVLTLPFHAFMGVTILGQETLIGGNWYPELAEGPMGAWLPNPHTDQQLAGGILWSAGDAIGLLFFAVLFVQWVRASMREAEREDRRLDLLEARAARAAAAAAAPTSSGAAGGAPGPDGGR